MPVGAADPETVGSRICFDPLQLDPVTKLRNLRWSIIWKDSDAAALRSGRLRRMFRRRLPAFTFDKQTRRVKVIDFPVMRLRRSLYLAAGMVLFCRHSLAGFSVSIVGITEAVHFAGLAGVYPASQKSLIVDFPPEFFAGTFGGCGQRADRRFVLGDTPACHQHRGDGYDQQEQQR